MKFTTTLYRDGNEIVTYDHDGVFSAVQIAKFEIDRMTDQMSGSIPEGIYDIVIRLHDGDTTIQLARTECNRTVLSCQVRDITDLPFEVYNRKARTT